MLWVALIMLALAFWTWSRVLKTFRELDRYEFEHRTSGGVVQFENYEASLRHQARKTRAQMLGAFGSMLLLTGFMILAFKLVF